MRGEAPLLDAYLRALDGDAAPFTIPGHKRSPAFGRVVAGDVPLHGGLDSVSLTGGVLVEAERRAAVLWGADVARFSVAGSTHGNQALALAVGRPGDRVVVPRTLHRSLLLGLVLAGLVPVWLPTRVDPGTGLPLGCRRADVERCLRDHPDVVAVFVGDPTYVGTVGELAEVADARARGGPAAAGRRRLGCALRLPPRAARARAAGRRRRPGDQRAQDAPGLLPGGDRPGPDGAARPGPPAERVRRDPHDQPGRGPAGEHRRRPRAAPARRRGTARPTRAPRRRGPRPARRGGRG